jgi:transcriptional regulator with XRE-family HTH domain
MSSRKAEASRPAIESHRKINREFIGLRIKASLHGLNVAEVARTLGVSRQTIYDWCAGKFMPDVERLDIFAAVTNVSLLWLITGAGAMRHNENHPGGYVVVQSLNVQPAPLAIQEEWLKQMSPLDSEGGDDLSDLQSVAAVDDAMEPLIRKGDLLIFRRRSLPAEERNPASGDNGLYVLQVVRFPAPSKPEELPITRWIVRRVLWGFDGSITITPDNPAYESEKQTCRPEKAPLILGPVLWRAGRI